MQPAPELWPEVRALAGSAATTGTQRDRPKRRADVSVRVVEGETIVFDRQAGLIHQLNPAASRVWECCDGTHTVAEIAERLTQEFDVDAATALRDVAAMVAQWRHLKLFEPGSA